MPTTITSQTAEQSEFLSRQQLAEALGLSLPTIARHLKDGQIPSVRLGGSRLIPRSFLEELKDQASVGRQE